MQHEPRTDRRPAGDVSLYRQVDAILRDQIADGVLRPGDRLPAEDALRTQYGVSRGTLRQALDALERDGLIERAAGRGTFIRAVAPPRARERAPVTAAELARTTVRRATLLQRCGAAPAPAVVADALGLNDAREVPFFIRFGAASRRDHAVGVKVYLHPDIAEHVRTLAEADDVAVALGELTGHAVAMGRAWVDAILAEPRFALQLGVPTGSPLISFWWVDRAGGQPLLCSQMLQPGATTTLLVGEGDV